MIITQYGFTMFTDYDLGDSLRICVSNLQKSIESDSTILDQDEKKYINKKIEEYKIFPIVLYVDKITVSHQEFEIPIEYFPSGFFFHDRQSFPKPVFTFHLPFDGDQHLFTARPSTRLMWTEEVVTSDKELKFEVINFSDDAEKIQKSRDEFLSMLQQQITNINNEINAYNSQLENIIISSMKKAKEKFNIQNDILSKLGNSSKNE